MIDALAIKAHEHGVVRVFALDMPVEQVRFLQEPGAVGQLLGVDQIDPGYVEIFPVSDLEELGLAGYLSEGCGIPDDQITPDLGKLKAVDGYVMVLLSRAFGGAETKLTPAPRIRLIAVYQEDPVDWTGTPMQTDSALPNSAATVSPRQARAISRRMGGTVFVIFMLIIAAVLFLVVL